MSRKGNAGVVLVALLLVSAPGLRSLQDRRILDSTADVNTGFPGTPLDAPAVVAGGFIYTSGLLGVDAATRGDQPGIAGETRRVLERLKTVLEAAGSSLGQAVSVTVYLRNASDFDALNAVYREFFPDTPPARTTVAADLPHGALVMVSAIAVPTGAARETMRPAGWTKTPRPYSYIVRAGDLVFLSGLVSRRGTDDQVVPGSIALQTRTILENAGVLLRTAGLSYSNVVAARVYLADDSLFEAMNDEYRVFLTGVPPARATAITGLIGNDSLVEISMIASATEKQPIGASVSPSLPISAAVRVGPRVFLSGVLGNSDANVGDVAAQTREMIAHIQRTLEAAGLSFSDVVDSTMYLSDLWQIDRVDPLYRDLFVKPPARATVGAKLVTRAGLVETMVTAVK